MLHRLYSALNNGLTSEFMGDFFPVLWGKYTYLKRLFLVIESPTNIYFTITQYCNGRNNTVEYKYSAGHHIISLGDVRFLGERLSCCLVSPDKEQQLYWATESPFHKNIGIAAIICSYNRIQNLKKIIADINLQNNFIEKIIIVNQGDVSLALNMFDKAIRKKITILEQKNFGGAGGFCRGIMQAQSIKNVTHIQLMDDDIQLTEGFFEILKAILSYLKTGYCVGGMMTDIKDRHNIISIGNDWQKDMALTNNRSQYMTNKLSTFISSFPEVDFCGWWSFCFPSSVLNKIGLPLPFFIHGDDLEFGLRLKKYGFQTLMWPGLEVSHPNLAEVSQPWHHFYECRNRLIIAYLYTKKMPMKAVIYSLRVAMNAVSLYDYHAAIMTLKAIESFFQGEKKLINWSMEDHASLLYYKHPESVDKPQGNRFILNIYNNSFMRTIITISRLFSAYFSFKSEEVTGPTYIVNLWRTGTKLYPKKLYFKKYNRYHYRQYNKKKARYCIKKAIKLLWFIFKNRKNNLYPNINYFISKEFWKNVFK